MLKSLSRLLVIPQREPETWFWDRHLRSDTGVRWVGVRLGSERVRGWAGGAGRAVSQRCLEASCVFLEVCSIKGLVRCSRLTRWCWVVKGFVPTTPLLFGQNVHPRGQKGHLKLNKKTPWKHLLSQLGQCWSTATALLLCLKSLQCC